MQEILVMMDPDMRDLIKSVALHIKLIQKMSLDDLGFGSPGDYLILDTDYENYAALFDSMTASIFHENKV